MRVVVLEDEPMVGGLLAAWLADAIPDAVVTPTVTADGALHLIQESGTDLLVTDLIIGGARTGIDVGIEAKVHNGAIGVVLITSHLFPQLLRRIPDHLLTGWAYLLKTHHSPTELASAVHAVLAGDMVLDAELIDLARGSAESPLAGLTPAEMFVVRRVAQGWSNAAIARDRGLTVKSVEHSLSNAYAKMGIDSRGHLRNPRVQLALTLCEFASMPPLPGRSGTS